ncbi:MAG: HIRAN domain-containing protein [Firmicutes bacterium]|nr:HIRAN domain-containing protein [Bacillota bacterium]
MQENMYVTITGFSHYYGKKPFSIGNLLVCEKDPSNKYDSEAIIARLPIIGQVGFISNSPYTMAGGTTSAGRIYDKVEDKFYVRVMFTTQSKVICRVESGSDGELEKEIQAQLAGGGDWLQK